MGTWSTITVPDSASGSYNADLMILLTDGSVLIHNGFQVSLASANEWLRLTPDLTQIDPTQRYPHGTWSITNDTTQVSTITMTNARQYFASGVLKDGRVFAIGGEDSDDVPDTPKGEIFDPETNVWTPIDKPASFSFVRGDCNGSILADGRVMLGGADANNDPPAMWPARTAIWDPSDNTWKEAGLAGGSQTKTDAFEEETWVLLRDGSVLAPAVRDTPGAQRYVPALDKWVDCHASPSNLAITTLSGTGVFETSAALLLPNGSAFIAGGSGNTAVFTPGPNQTDPGSWTAGPTFPNDTSAGHAWPTLTALDAPGVLLPSGRVLTMAGTTALDDGGFFSQNPILFEYDPVANSLTQLPHQPALPALSGGMWTWMCSMLLLPTGQVLLSCRGNTIFVYTPDSADGVPDPAWKPTITNFPPKMNVGQSYTIFGTQFNGLSQACSYGDDGGMATNYPIVQLTSQTHGTVRYVRSHSFSTLGVATGTDTVSCIIDVPDDLDTGVWDMVVIANGIQSDAATVQIQTVVTAKDCFFIVDDSTFSDADVASPPAAFDKAFSVVVEGFSPSDLNLDVTQLGNPPIKPQIPNPFATMQISFSGPLLCEDPSLPDTPQRFTFPYEITFTDKNDFANHHGNVTLNATFTPQSGPAVSNSATVVLTANPNPFIKHGDETLNPPEPWYLSQDIRVFQVGAGGGTGMFGATLQSGQPIQFIQDVINNLRNNVSGARAAFDAIPQDEDSEALALAQDDLNGFPVYNFAVARVRLRDTQTASKVGAFFRVVSAQATGGSFSYDPNVTFRSKPSTDPSHAGDLIPVLGLDASGNVLSIPFFATARVAVDKAIDGQSDPINRIDMSSSPPETDFFFGCWLDINQPGDARFPQTPITSSQEGPFDNDSPVPILNFMMAGHQCLIVEISYSLETIPLNSDPSTTDKLAQRNLSFVWAPNPGLPASRRVPQPFELKPASPRLAHGQQPDELMIEWRRMPKGSFAEVFLPAADAATILDAANDLYTLHNLEQIDAHTLRFPAAGVTYLPAPAGIDVTQTGLLTVDLPDGIRKGQTFEAVVRQITGMRGFRQTDKPRRGKTAPPTGDLFAWKRTIGQFKLSIPVSTKQVLLPREEQLLSIMKWIARTKPRTDRWFPVLMRYIDQISGRVRFMGGDPETVLPSGTGSWKIKPAHPLGELLVGKIAGVIFDAFGDFDGFWLESAAGGFHRFDSREPSMRHAVEEAFGRRTRIGIEVDKRRPHHALAVVLLA